MASSTSAAPIPCVGQLTLIPAESFEPFLSSEGIAVATAISYISSSDLSPMTAGGHVGSPGPGPMTAGGHVGSPGPGPMTAGGHVGSPGPAPMTAGGHVGSPGPGPMTAGGHVGSPGPSPMAAATFSLTVGQIMMQGGIRSSSQLAFRIEADSEQSLPTSFALQIVEGQDLVVFQTQMSFFDEEHLGSDVVLAFDSEAATESANYFALENHLRIVTETEDDMKKIQSIIIGKHSN